MKIALLTSLFFGMAFLLWYCKPSKFTADNLPKTYIKWGSGGGFVGKETTYTLLENGQVFKYDGVKETTGELKSIKKKTTSALFNSLTDLEIDAVRLNQPDNMYYFLEIGKGDAPVRLVWGDKSKEMPKKVKDLYVVLGQLVK